MYRVHHLLDRMPEPSSLNIKALRPGLPGLADCTLSEVVEERPEDWPAPAHVGLLDFWFGSLEDAERSLQDTDINALLPGARLARSFLGQERVVMRLPEFFTEGRHPIKGVYLFRSKPGMLLDDFRDYWWLRHGPIAARTQDALCYVQSHLLTADDYQGITELYWRSPVPALAAIASPQMLHEQAPDAVHFVNLTSLQPLLVRERRLVSRA